MPPSRRDELVEAAMNVFARCGFHSTNLDKVLTEAGISRMTLYNHFKSKDELIVAALRRRDEIVRNQMMKFVESQASEPIDRILAVFDFHQNWFAADDFSGCMFINAAAEYTEPESPMRRVAAEHKGDIRRYLVELARAAELANAEQLAHQLTLLLDGAIINAQVAGLTGYHGAAPPNAARQARDAAQTLIRAATSS